MIHDNLIFKFIPLSIVFVLLGSHSVSATTICNGSPTRDTALHQTWDNCIGEINFGSGTKMSGKWRNGLLVQGMRTSPNGTITKVGKKPNKPKSSLRDAFITLTKTQRYSIQLKLKEVNLYRSSVDSLYGKGTAAALKAYNKEYLGNADLTKKANVDALIVDILKPLPSETTQVMTAQLEPVSATPEPEPAVAPAAEPEEAPNTLTDMQESYDSKDYFKAREAAEALAIDGEADAQFLLGRMYAEGLGTLQISKTAHMWFNIASLNGSAEAITERNAVAASMSRTAVEEAQELALKCIQSKYADCGLSIKPKQMPELQQPAVTVILDGAALGNDFKVQSVLRRKQLQYALMKLGVYNSSVDGLWGNGTRRAFTTYIERHELKVASGEEIFASVLSKIDVPSTFAAASPPKKKQRKTFIDTAGLTAIIASPTISGSQALAICEPQAKMTAQNDYDQSRSSRKKKITCKTKSDILGSETKCKESSGGWPGLLPLLLEVDPESQANKKANSTYQLALSSCLAQYGWKK